MTERLEMLYKAYMLHGLDVDEVSVAGCAVSFFVIRAIVDVAVLVVLFVAFILMDTGMFKML